MQHVAPRWCADYKGEFMLADKRYCYPLTITDAASRYLLSCEALSSTKASDIQRVAVLMGASSGIGKETAKALAAQGWRAAGHSSSAV
jgi:transposase InsO family protein